MCKDNVNLPKEANKAKCFVISCFVLCASPGAHGGDGCTTKKKHGGSRAPACGHAAAPSSHAMHMHCVCVLLLLMHCTHLRQLHLLADRLRCFLAGRDWRGLRDPRMHRLEHPYVLRPGDYPGGRWEVLGGAQEHAARRDTHPQPVRHTSLKKLRPPPPPAHRPLCCSSSLASSS